MLLLLLLQFWMLLVCGIAVSTMARAGATVCRVHACCCNCREPFVAGRCTTAGGPQIFSSSCMQVNTLVHQPTARGMLAAVQLAVGQAPSKLQALTPEQRDALRAVLLQASLTTCMCSCSCTLVLWLGRDQTCSRTCAELVWQVHHTARAVAITCFDGRLWQITCICRRPCCVCMLGSPGPVLLHNYFLP